MIPSDYVAQFKAEGSTKNALAKVVNGIYKELKNTEMENNGLKFSDLDKAEAVFQAFRKNARKFADGTEIPEHIFKRALQTVQPAIFHRWNTHCGGNLLPY